jgi:hypothetical protein
MSALRRYFILLCVLVTASLALNLVLPWPLTATVAALSVGWPIAGTIITIDDDFPGGWSNPDGKSTPEWQTATWWADIILCRGTFAVLAAAFDARADIPMSVALIATAVVMAAIGFPIVVKSLRLYDSANS